MAKAKKVKEGQVEEIETTMPVEETPVIEQSAETKEPDFVEVNGEKIELMDVVVSEETLAAAPEMIEEGLKVGDVIQVAATDEGDAKLTEALTFGTIIDETFEEISLSNDAARWERYLKTMGLTPEKFLETRPKNHPHRRHIEEIVTKRKK